MNNNKREALVEGDRIQALLRNPSAHDRFRIELEPQANGFEIAAFLERAAEASLNPFAGEIWLARIGARPVAVTTHSNIGKMGDRSKRIDSIAAFPVGEHDVLEADFWAGSVTLGVCDTGFRVGAWAMVASDGRRNNTFCHVRKNYSRTSKASFMEIATSMAIRHVLGFGDLIVTDELVPRHGGIRRIEPHLPAYLLSSPKLSLRWTKSGERSRDERLAREG
jgi:hypothetical protein